VVALMLVAVLHFITDEDKPARVIAPLLRAAVERAYREAGIPVQLCDSSGPHGCG
jgi:hypothetical protein